MPSVAIVKLSLGCAIIVTRTQRGRTANSPSYEYVGERSQWIAIEFHCLQSHTCAFTYRGQVGSPVKSTIAKSIWETTRFAYVLIWNHACKAQRCYYVPAWLLVLGKLSVNISLTSVTTITMYILL